MDEYLNFETEFVVGIPATDRSGKPFSITLVGSYVVIPKSQVPTII